MILLFKYNDKYLKFIPHDDNCDLVDYSNNNLPNGTPYKILSSIDNLSDSDYEILLNSPDGVANNSVF